MKRFRGGHNLLEVIIATFIFATAVIMMTGMWATYHRALTQNKARMMAMAVARSELERHLANGYTNEFAVVPNQISQPAPSPPIKLTFAYNFDSWVRGRHIPLSFTGNTVIVDCSALGTFPKGKQLAHVIVTVDWEEGSGPQELKYDAYMFETR